MRLAEEIAYVDALSGGRLDVGVGGGSQAHESCFMQFGGLERDRVVRSMRRFLHEVVPKL